MAENDVASVAASATSSSVVAKNHRTEQQIKKLKDANAKYKDLLRLAKERIQSQEEELERVKGKQCNRNCISFRSMDSICLSWRECSFVRSFVRSGFVYYHFVYFGTSLPWILMFF
jgi:hypothetical protein